MTVFLDTHTFLWYDAEPVKLSARAAQLLTNPNNRLLLGVVSIWELVSKSQLGKLPLRAAVRTVVEDQVARNALELLEVTVGHVYTVGTLPAIHKNPFDHLLTAQAIVEGAVFLTDDPIFQKYPVQTDW